MDSVLSRCLKYIIGNHCSDLEERRFLQHVQEFWEIVSNFLVHGADQADLSHGPRPVRSRTVGPTHLRGDVTVSEHFVVGVLTSTQSFVCFDF